MTSKSFSSKGLLWDTMRRNLWALVLSGVGFFLSLLLPVMMQVQTTLANRADWLKNLSQAQVDQNWQISMDTLAELLGSGNVFVKCALVVMAVVSGVALFAFAAQRKRQLFHRAAQSGSVPRRRGCALLAQQRAVLRAQRRFHGCAAQVNTDPHVCFLPMLQFIQTDAGLARGNKRPGALCCC